LATRPTAQDILEKAIARSGHNEHQLRIDLATGTKTQAWIRKQYCLSVDQLNTFMEREADNIAAIGLAVNNKKAIALQGLWAADKKMRIADMQRDVDDINEVIDYRRDEEGFVDPVWAGKSEFTNLMRTKTALLRSIADEIDGTRRALVPPDDERQQVRYVINAGLAKDLT
jgi:hypothetical protein